MERKVNIQDWQKVTVEDFNNFGLLPRATPSTTSSATSLIPDMAYTGISPRCRPRRRWSTVGNGRLYHNGLVFYNDNGRRRVARPAGRPPRRHAALCRRRGVGQEIETDTEPRTFLTDPVTRATVARVVSTESRRWANISTVVGAEGPDPQRPAVASNTLAGRLDTARHHRHHLHPNGRRASRAEPARPRRPHERERRVALAHRRRASTRWRPTSPRWPPASPARRRCGSR